ncbi:MAG: hypothetical protein AAFV77_00660, partial [Planctomycetota bacterium]
MGDWIFTVLTWLLLALGVLGLAWALFWDRSRGRKRCPKCWYRLDGVPAAEGTTTCPECGKEVRKPRRMLKTRRRWGLAMLALLAVLGSYASHAYPIVRDHGWWRTVPDVALIAMVPLIDPSATLTIWPPTQHPLFIEAWQRTIGQDESWWKTDQLLPWERWLLRRQSLALLERAENPHVAAFAAQLFVISTDNPVSVAPLQHKGRVILAWSKRRFNTCTTYVEVGVAMDHDPVQIRWGYEPDLYPEMFLTAFERGVRIHEEQCRLNLPARWLVFPTASWMGPDGRAFWWRNVTRGQPRELPSYSGVAPSFATSALVELTMPWGSILDMFEQPTL